MPIFAVQNVSINDLAFGVVGEDDFIAGGMTVEDQPVSWESDVGWSISVRSLDADLGLSGSGTYTKPLGDLQWKLSSESIWIPMTQTDAEVDFNSSTGSGVIYMDFLVELHWDADEPGDYGADLLFTISAL